MLHVVLGFPESANQIVSPASEIKPRIVSTEKVERVNFFLATGGKEFCVLL